jgi:prephenate dehydrogenase
MGGILRGNTLQLKDLKKIGIVGPGLLGGSIGLALKSHNIPAEVIGIGHRQSSIDRAVQIGAIDRGSLNLADLTDCQLVILATPISLIRTALSELEPILQPGSVVTDVGSTKRQICEWAGPLGKRGIEFVGSHPIAGSEKRGVDFARPDLFLNANCFVTPTSKNSSEAVNLIGELWRLIGMRVVKTSPRQHDKLLATVSHLPHVVAAGLVNVCTEDQLKYTGTGFLDTSRIASGDVNLWRDIILSNPDCLNSALKKFITQLEKFQQAIEAGDSKKICKLLETAKHRRDDMVQFKYNHQQIES